MNFPFMVIPSTIRYGDIGSYNLSYFFNKTTILSFFNNTAGVQLHHLSFRVCLFFSTSCTVVYSIVNDVCIETR